MSGEYVVQRERALHSNATWFHSPYGKRLHFVPKADAGGNFFDDATHPDADTRAEALCNTFADWTAPGPFSHMGLPRCSGCCKALGIPDGDGAPTNDKALR